MRSVCPASSSWLHGAAGLEHLVVHAPTRRSSGTSGEQLVGVLERPCPLGGWSPGTGRRVGCGSDRHAVSRTGVAESPGPASSGWGDVRRRSPAGRARPAASTCGAGRTAGSNVERAVVGDAHRGEQVDVRWQVAPRPGRAWPGRRQSRSRAVGRRRTTRRRRSPGLEQPHRASWRPLVSSTTVGEHPAHVRQQQGAGTQVGLPLDLDRVGHVEPLGGVVRAVQRPGATQASPSRSVDAQHARPAGSRRAAYPPAGTTSSQMTDSAATPSGRSVARRWRARSRPARRPQRRPGCGRAPGPTPASRSTVTAAPSRSCRCLLCFDRCIETECPPRRRGRSQARRGRVHRSETPRPLNRAARWGARYSPTPWPPADRRTTSPVAGGAPGCHRCGEGGADPVEDILRRRRPPVRRARRRAPRP